MKSLWNWLVRGRHDDPIPESGRGPAETPPRREVPLSRHVFGVEFFLRIGTISEIEGFLISRGASGEGGFWVLDHPEYNKIDLCLVARRADWTDERARMFGIDWPPVASGDVYIKGTVEADSLRHFQSLLVDLTERFAGVTVQTSAGTGPESVFTATDLRAGRNAQGMTFRELVR